MKKITLMLLLVTVFAAHAQKQPKPNVNKILSLLQEGKVKDAKEMADLAATYEKTRNDGKAWYHRGLVYLVLDTTSQEAFKSLSSDAFNEAVRSFKKADSLAGKNEYFVSAGMDFDTKPQQIERWANFWLNKGLQTYQDQPDESLSYLDKTKKLLENQMEKYANDTLTYYVSSIVANGQEKYDLAIADAQKYFERGGKSRDVYVVLYQIYNQSETHKNQDKALEIVREAKNKLPNDPVFPRLEIELLVKMDKVADAKAGLEEAVRKEPNDKQLHYSLGYVNLLLKDGQNARTNFQNALKIDPQYFDAKYQLAMTYLLDVDAISKEWSSLGNTAAESKKRSELVQKRVKASEVALPHLEELEKMKAPDSESQIDILEKMKLLYYYTADDKNMARVTQKLKALGVED